MLRHYRSLKNSSKTEASRACTFNCKSSKMSFSSGTVVTGTKTSRRPRTFTTRRRRLSNRMKQQNEPVVVAVVVAVVPVALQSNVGDGASSSR